jgi:hypothetical protein
MKLLGWRFVIVTCVLVAACCGGIALGAARVGPAVKAPPCPVRQVSRRQTGRCLSPDGVWRLTYRARSGSKGKLFLARRGQAKSALMYAGDGFLSYITWAKPHLLFFIDDFQVMSLDPTRRKVRHLAQLDDLVVSPNGRWFAGSGAGGHGNPVASQIYVLSANARQCLVVPGQAVSVRGFTRNSKAVIVLRALRYPETRLVRFGLASLRAGCPTGPNGVLPDRG